MDYRFLKRLSPERILLFTSVALGFLHAWVGRNAMNPDGVSYLDVGDSFFRRDWTNAVNAWWSPLYPWTMGLVLGLTKPSTKWEFPLVHAVNFVVFVLALLAFRFLLHGFAAFGHGPPSATNPNNKEALPEWGLVVLGYSIFLWVALEVETLYDVSPDLAVMACVCLAAGTLLRLRPDDAPWKFALFGLILGVGYWTKTILLPLGFVALGAGYWWKRSLPGWRRGMVVAGLVFLCASAPLIFLLSKEKGRLTFGDSGRVNYAWYVSPRTFWRNWQGEEAASGKPAHPTRQLLLHPPVFEFDGPVIGTYPPWTDPSYWNEGVAWHFKLKPQMEVLDGTIPSEVRLLFRARPELVAGLIVLALLGGQLWLSGLRALWPLIAIPIVGMGVYLPLVENDRYLGGFVLVFFLTLLAAVRLRSGDQRVAGYIVLVVFSVMALGTLDYTVRIITNHLAIPGSGPNSTLQDLVAAEQLRKMGSRPGDKVAVIGDGTGAYWARLAKLRIVAEIMDANHGSREFWESSPETKESVYAAFEKAGAVLTVASCAPNSPAGWQRIEGTRYCVLQLQTAAAR